MEGIVIRSTGSWYSVLTEESKKYDCRIRGSFRMKGIKSTNPIAVGDRVVFELEPGKETGVINEIKNRKNYIIRKSINLSKRTHILGANVDQALLIATIASPRTSTGFIDRFLVTAEAYQIPVIIAFNKKDIYTDEEKEDALELINLYSSIGYTTCLTSIYDPRDMDHVMETLGGKITIVSGHSGVGKSSLINAIAPDLHLKTGDISTAHDKGKHTTTFAEMHSLPFGGFIIDTPGIKEFGLVGIRKEELTQYFPEMRAAGCRFKDCQHINEPGCKIKTAVEEGKVALSRYENYFNILHDEQKEDYE